MRKIEKNVLLRIIISFLIATIMFTGLFLISDTISYMNNQKIEEKSDAILNTLQELQKKLDNFSCNYGLFIKASEELDDVGVKIALLEKRFGKYNERVLEKKEEYSKIEILHYSLIKKFQENCNRTFFPIFFFYSNSEELYDESERISFILSTFKRKNPEEIMIYSFDYNLNSKTVLELKKRYNISFAPSVLIVNKKDLISPQSIDNLEKYLEK